MNIHFLPTTKKDMPISLNSCMYRDVLKKMEKRYILRFKGDGSTIDLRSSVADTIEDVHKSVEHWADYSEEDLMIILDEADMRRLRGLFK